MKMRVVLHPCLASASLGLAISVTLASTAHAANGLATPVADAWWPQLQARIALQSATLSSLSTTSLLAAGAAPPATGGSLQGGAIFGDYYFATPSFGSFRASGGLMTGLQGGLPISNTSAGPRLGVALNGGTPLLSAPWMTGADTPGTVPYLGLGFSGGAWRNSLSISADLGLVAERSGSVGRALFGNQAFDGAVREMRLSPVLQLGVRYTF